MPPQQLAQMAQVLKGQTGREAAPRHVIQRAERLKQRAFTRGLPFGVEPDDLGRAGWGIVFHENEAAAVRKEMQVLVDHRRRHDTAPAAGGSCGSTSTGWPGCRFTPWSGQASTMKTSFSRVPTL